MDAVTKELKGERRSLLVSTAIVYLICLVNVVNITIFIPTSRVLVESMGGDDQFNGLMVGLLPIVQGILNIPNAHLLNRVSLRTFLSLACCCYVLGNMLYVVAGATNNKWVLLASRCVSAGIGGTTVYANYVVRAWPESDRTWIMLVMSSSNALAYAVGPGVASVLLWLMEDGGPLSDYAFHNRLLTSSVAPAWFQAAVSLALLLMAMFVFSEPVPPELKGPIDAAAKQGAQCGDEPGEKVPRAGLTIVFYLAAAITLATGSWEVHSERLAAEIWGWSGSATASYLSGVMFFLMPVILSAGFIAKRGYTSDRLASLLLSLGAGGCTVAMLWTDIVPYTAGSALMLMALQVERGFVSALVTKLSPKHCVNFSIAIFGLIICFGRGLGAVLGTLRSQQYVGAMIALSASQVLLISVGFRKLKPRA
jgi:hypothetical protein